MDTLALLGGGVKDFDVEKRDFRKLRPKVSFWKNNRFLWEKLSYSLKHTSDLYLYKIFIEVGNRDFTVKSKLEDSLKELAWN